MTETYRFRAVNNDKNIVLYLEESSDLPQLKEKMGAFMDDSKYVVKTKETYDINSITLIIEQFCMLCKEWTPIVASVEFL